MLNCKDFVKQQNERLDGREASFMERMSLKMHELICHHCRRYLKQLKLVDSVGHNISESTVDDATIQSNLAHIQKHNQSENS